MQKIKVAIPLKTNSERCPNKNLRDFCSGKSLFDIKAKQLLKFFKPSDIYVSSENKIVNNLCRQYGFNFNLRDIELTKSTARENIIVKDIVSPIPKDSDVMWVQVTQPLFDEFDKIMSIWNNICNEYDSLVVVKKARHHLLDSYGNPVNFNFGYWHKISQELPPLYEVTWSAFIMSRKLLDQTYYQIGRKPYLYVTEAPLVDIDTISDFEVASILYRYYSNKTI